MGNGIPILEKPAADMYEEMVTPSLGEPVVPTSPLMDSFRRTQQQQQQHRTTIRPSWEYRQQIELETVTKIDVNEIILQSVEPPDHSHLSILGTSFLFMIRDETF